MALFKSFVLGDVRKSVANITMYAGANGYSIAEGRETRCVIPGLRAVDATGEDESVIGGIVVFCSGGRARFSGTKGRVYVL